MIHLTLPPFDYISAPPYIVSCEPSGFEPKVAHTLVVALLEWFPYGNAAADVTNTITRLIDRRGVCILGLDSHDLIGHPHVVATEETLTSMRAMMPDIAGGIENFEMVVRSTYVHLRGGT